MRDFSDLLRKQRSRIMGIAILWVVWYHMAPGIGLPGLFGYGGVDIFFFLSGFGLCHSLKNDPDIGRYLKRRAMRLLPSYIPVCLLWLCFTLLKTQPGITQSLRIVAGNLTMFGYFANTEMISWYISGLALSIFAAPLFFAVLKNKYRRKTRMNVMFAALLFLCAAFIGCDQLIIISRLPLFLLGMTVAFSDNDTLAGYAGISIAGFISGIVILSAAVLHFPDTLLFYGLYWLPFIGIVPFGCLLLGKIVAYSPPPIQAGLELIGKSSFEIFLFDVCAELLLKKYGLGTNSINWIFFSLCSVLLGISLHSASINLISGKKHIRG